MAVELLPSALSHFDPTDLFDALATGIIVDARPPASIVEALAKKGPQLIVAREM